MCVAVPAEIIELKDHDLATVLIGGIKKEISVALMDNLRLGDYVIVHMGHALNRLDVGEAEATLKLMREIGMNVGEPGQ